LKTLTDEKAILGSWAPKPGAESFLRVSQTFGLSFQQISKEELEEVSIVLSLQ
jgi:hypothetical protein